MTSEHRIAAVLFSDIEGYTTIMQENEAAGISMVNRYQQVLEDTVPRHQGKVMQHYGDGSLTIFDRASDALDCSMELHHQFQENVPLRMGIHLGKVVFHDHKIFGETVNIASRVESLGQPGTILFSQEVYQQIKDQPEYKPVSMGQYKFKNVAREMEVFALANDGLKVPEPGTLEGKLQASAPANSTGRIFLALALLLLGVLAFFFFTRKQGPSEAVTADLSRTIAVLPFTNLSSDSSQEYFADGLSVELLNLLAQESQLRVTSRSSSFSFKGQSLDIPSIAQKLGVKYVLEGSVRKSGNALRINTQLIDAGQDQQLWAQTWERDLEDVFAVQQEIADSVKNVLRVQLLAPKVQEADPQAYTLYLQAKHVGQHGNQRSLTIAESLIRESLKIDSLYAPAWSYLGLLLNRQANIGAIPPDEGHELARQASYRALAIDSAQVLAWTTLTSIALYYDWDFQAAQDYLMRVTNSEPGNLNGIKLASNLAFCLGKVQEAIVLDHQAIQLDPVTGKNYLDLGFNYYYQGNGTEAERMARQALIMSPDHIAGPYLLFLAFLQQGKLAEAKTAALKEPYEILRVQARAVVASSLGEQDSAAIFLSELIQKYHEVAPYQVAQVYAHQKKIDSAFHWLDLAYAYRDGGLIQVQADPFMKGLKKDKRWEALVTKVGFPGK